MKRHNKINSNHKMSYYSPPMSLFSLNNLSNSFPPVRVPPNLQQMEINRLNSEIYLLSNKIQQLESSKKDQDSDQERIMSHNNEILEMCRTLLAEKQELQSKFDNALQNTKDERNCFNSCIIDLQAQIGILENKLSEMQVKALSEFETTSLKQENERLLTENERLSKSNAFWILKIYKFLLTSRLKHKYNGELNRMRDLVMNDYTKTGKVVARTKVILEECFSMEHK